MLSLVGNFRLQPGRTKKRIQGQLLDIANTFFDHDMELGRAAH